MATPINPKENSIAGLRPARSPNPPITSPPSGRVKKPTPNVASVSSRPLLPLALGKKVVPIWTAKIPKIRKS